MSDLYAAPTDEEIKSTSTAGSDLYSAPTPDEIKETEPMSVGGFGKNLLEDVKGTAKGVVGLGKGLMEHPIQTVESIPSGLINEGKRIGLGELLTGHPINAAEKFGRAAYEKPLTTAFDVAPIVGAAGKALGIGGKVAPVAEGADIAAESIPELEAIPKGVAGKSATMEAAEDFAKNPPPPPPQRPPVSDAAFTDNIAQKAKEVNSYINQKYGNFANKPGAMTDAADYLNEKSQMMSAQQMGFTPLQNRQLGATPTEQLANIRAIGQYGLDSGTVSPMGGLRHMVKTNADLLNKAGKTLGDLRQEADKLRDPVAMPIDPLQEIRSKLDPLFSRGARSGEAGSYQKALEMVEDADPTFQGMADVSTKLNKAANEANRLQQPHGAFTDVANIISRIENDRIRQILGPQKAAVYDQALKEFGINKKIEAALKRKVGGEVKRLGPGSLTSNLAQKVLDEVGYRVGAKALNKLSGSVLKNPSVGKSLPSLFKEFGNHIDETAGEVSGLAKGGIVGNDELNDLLASKYGNQP